jgi:sulfhydrogenase subunit alpha
VILEAVGGRAIHPVNTRLGGFYRAPTPADLAPLAEQLRRALDAALDTVIWVAGFDFPDAELGCELLAAAEPDRYAIEAGVPTTASGLSFPAAAFSDHVTEHQVPHSTALHATLDGRSYLTGPLARYTISSARLSLLARQAAAAAGLGLGLACRNPFRSIVVRPVEMLYALGEALAIIGGHARPDSPFTEVRPVAGTGHGVSVAPRGLLYRRYRLDGAGRIESAVIVPPTAQNQAVIEADLAPVVGENLDLDDAGLTALCERVIRNYDPCISCSAHFLDLRIERR